MFPLFTLFYYLLLFFTKFYLRVRDPADRIILVEGCGKEREDTLFFSIVSFRTETYSCVQGGAGMMKEPEKEEGRNGKTVRGQSSLFVQERRSGIKNTRTLDTRTLYRMGNAWNGEKGGPAGLPGCVSDADGRVFLRL